MKQYRAPRLGEIGSYLSGHGYGFKTYGGDRGENFKLSKAPCCGHHDSLSINSETGLWECHYFPCGKTGNWITFRRLVNDPIPDDQAITEMSLINYTDEWIRFFEGSTRGPVTRNKYPKVLEYCKKRGISEETLDAFRVSNKWDDQVRFPLYAWRDEWVMVNARTVGVLDEKTNFFEMRGGPTHLLVGNNLLDPDHEDKTAFIFEGQWDAMSAYEIGMRNVFSLPNGAKNVNVSAMLQYIPSHFRVVICTDMDKAGDMSAEKFFLQLGPERFTRLHLPKPYKDLNDWLLANPQLNKEEVIDCAKGLIHSKMEKKAYRKIKRNIPDAEKQKPLIETPFSQMSRQFRGGFYPSQMTSILAASGSGKTTLVNQIAVHCSDRTVSTGLISLEGSEQELDEKIDRTITGMITNENDSNVLHNLHISPLRGKTTTHEEIILQVSQMVYGDGCKIVIVDNLDYITGSTDQKKYDTTGKLMTICDQAKAHLIMVWQPNKVDPGKPVTSYNQKGESRIYQDSHNYINMNNRHPDGKVIEIEKNREFGKGDEKIFLTYNREHNIYFETMKNTKLSVISLQNV